VVQNRFDLHNEMEIIVLVDKMGMDSRYKPPPRIFHVVHISYVCTGGMLY
jgi:hypothetical protein